jgi:hypothetical protein
VFLDWPSQLSHFKTTPTLFNSKSRPGKKFGRVFFFINFILKCFLPVGHVTFGLTMSTGYVRPTLIWFNFKLGWTRSLVDNFFFQFHYFFLIFILRFFLLVDQIVFQSTELYYVNFYVV